MGAEAGCSIPHERGIQVLTLMGHDLGGLLAVEHGQFSGHVHIHTVHGDLGQETVDLRPGRGHPIPQVDTGVGAGACAGLVGGGALGGAGA